MRRRAKRHRDRSRDRDGAVPTVERPRFVPLRASRTRTAPRSSRVQPRATVGRVPVTDPADPGCEATRARVCRRRGGTTCLVFTVFCCLSDSGTAHCGKRVDSPCTASPKFKPILMCMDKQSSNIFQRQKVDFAKCEETSGSLAPFDAALSRSWSEVSLYERTRRRCTTRALVITRRSCQGVGRVNGRDGIP